MKLRQLMISVMTAALVLGGAAPSFALQENKEKAPPVSGTSAVLMDAETGDVIYEKNPREKRTPASVTKVLTCLVALENLDMDDTFTIPGGIDGTPVTAELKEGETCRIKDLMYVTMIYSANDAAEALATAVAGSVERFCAMMNRRARECGAVDTCYVNASGLNGPGTEGHLTTAYDLALIGREAMKNREFRKIVSTGSYTMPATNMSGERRYMSTNLCLDTGRRKEGEQDTLRYVGCNGVKTGYTSTAGECYMGSAVRGEVELIAVILNADEGDAKFDDAVRLWDYGFSKYDTFTLLSAGETAGELDVRRGAKGEVDAALRKDLDITLGSGSREGDIEQEAVFSSDEIEAPVKKGTRLGRLKVYGKDGGLIASEPLYASEDVDEGGCLSYIGIPDEDVPAFAAVCAAAAAAAAVIIRRLRMTGRGRPSGTGRRSAMRAKANRKRRSGRKSGARGTGRGGDV